MAEDQNIIDNTDPKFFNICLESAISKRDNAYVVELLEEADENGILKEVLLEKSLSSSGRNLFYDNLNRSTRVILIEYAEREWCAEEMLLNKDVDGKTGLIKAIEDCGDEVVISIMECAKRGGFVPEILDTKDRMGDSTLAVVNDWSRSKLLPKMWNYAEEAGCLKEQILKVNDKGEDLLFSLIVSHKFDLVEELLLVAEKEGCLKEILSRVSKLGISPIENAANTKNKELVDLVLEKMDLVDLREDAMLPLIDSRVSNQVWNDRNLDNGIVDSILTYFCSEKGEVKATKQNIEALLNANDYVEYIASKVTAHYLYLGTEVDENVYFIDVPNTRKLKQCTMQAFVDCGLDLLDIAALSTELHEGGPIPSRIQNCEEKVEWESAFTVKNDDKSFVDFEVEIEGKKRFFRIESLNSSDDLMKMTNISQSRAHEGGSTLCTGTMGQDKLCAEGSNRYIAIIEIDKVGQKEVSNFQYVGGMQIKYDSESKVYSELEFFDMRNNKRVEPYYSITQAFLKEAGFKGFGNIVPKLDVKIELPEIFVNDDAKETHESKERSGQEFTYQQIAVGSDVKFDKFIEKLKFLVKHRSVEVYSSKGKYASLCGMKYVGTKLKDAVPDAREKYLDYQKQDLDFLGVRTIKRDSTERPWAVAKSFALDNEDTLPIGFMDSLDNSIPKVFVEEIDKAISKKRGCGFKPPRPTERAREAAIGAEVQNEVGVIDR